MPESKSLRIVWEGEVDGVRTRVVRPAPDCLYVEVMLRNLSAGELVVLGLPAPIALPEGLPEADYWSPCGDDHARHAYEAALLHLIGGVP